MKLNDFEDFPLWTSLCVYYFFYFVCLICFPTSIGKVLGDNGIVFFLAPFIITAVLEIYRSKVAAKSIAEDHERLIALREQARQSDPMYQWEVERKLYLQLQEEIYGKMSPAERWMWRPKGKNEWYWRPKNKDEEYLQQLADKHLPLFEGMTRVKVYLVDKLDTDKPAVGLGGGGEMWILKSHYELQGDGEVLHTIKHELIHNWQSYKGYEMGHNENFNQKAREIGVDECWD
jgi:hypothetical protein